MSIKKIINKVNEYNTNIVVSLNPKGVTLSENYDKENFEYDYKSSIDLISNYAGFIKFNSAYYEVLGGNGLVVLENLIFYARAKGLYVIFDGKRSDVPHTNVIYGKTYLGNNSAYECDALTTCPYIGPDSIKELINASNNFDKEVFVYLRENDFSNLIIQNNGLKSYEYIIKYLYKNMKNAKLEDGYQNLGFMVNFKSIKIITEIKDLFPSACVIIDCDYHEISKYSFITNTYKQFINKKFNGYLFDVPYHYLKYNTK